MNTITKTFAGISIAFFALFSLAFTFSVAQAADFGDDYGWVDTGTYDTWGSSQDTWNDYGWVDTGYQDTYAPTYGSGSTGGSSGGGYSMPSFGGSSGGGYSMPSFGSANYGYRAAYEYPTYQQPSKSSSNTTVTTNTCTNNSCNSSYVDNSIVDNSIEINDSYNTVYQKSQQKEQYRDDCYDYGYNQGYGYNGYSEGYGQDGYNYGAYNYQGNCYSYSAPVAYNTTPYISLSQTPYTGLDLGPMGEVLYWTFLVLWCLAAAYMIVVKRVQNKLVAFLNGFLFGTSTKTTVAHATHAPAHTHAVASAPLVEEGIDSFIQSQIKRS